MEIQTVKEVRRERTARLPAMYRYSRDVDSKGMLPGEEICSLARCGDLLSRNKIVESNLRFVIKVAREKMESANTRHMRMADFVQEGNIGLIKAAQKFDPDKGTNFLSYSKWWIEEEIDRAVENLEHTIGVPVHKQEDIVSLKRTRSFLTKKLGDEPSIEEIATAMDIDVERAKDLECIEIFSSETSLDIPVGNGNAEGVFSTLGDLIPCDKESPFSSFLGKEQREVLLSVLSSLKEKERQVILLRCGFEGEDHTLESAGERMGLSRERIRQIESDALKRLKKKSKLKELRNSMN